MPESASPAYRLVQLFQGRRMVLVIECGEGDLLAQLHEMGVPSIGVDSDPDRALRGRERQLLTWTGTWRVLHFQQQKFDGIYLDWTDLDETVQDSPAALLSVLGMASLPRGLIIVASIPPGALREEDLPDDLELRGVHEGNAILSKAPATVAAPRDDVGIIVHPYADAFVGCENVLDLGCGRGRFLDHLKVRDVPCSGIEADREMAFEAMERDLAVEVGGAALLATRPNRYDGIFLGNVLDPLPFAEATALLQMSLFALRPGGRILVRGTVASHQVAEVEAQMQSLGYHELVGKSLPEDPAGYYVTGLKPQELTTSPPATVPEIYTRDREINLPLRSLHDLERFERKIHSQGGEDGVLAAIFEIVGTTNRFYVEFGCGDGLQCNTAHLRRQGWSGILMDGGDEAQVEDAVIHREWITPDNINQLFAKHNVPKAFDLLSIDLDGNDYWVLQALDYQPRVIVAEYNGNLPPDQRLTIKEDPEHVWDGGDYYGASLLALADLLAERGYLLVYCNGAGVNAFFVHRDFVGNLEPRPVAEVYRRANYWYRGGRQFPDLGRTMVNLDSTP